LYPVYYELIRLAIALAGNHNRHMQKLQCVLIVLLLLAGLGCDAGKPQVSTIVLVTVDTWRWDATGFLGRREPSPTPFLDQLAAGGLVAVDTVAPVPLTGPSHWSMLTGRWPWRDGIRVNGDPPVAGHPSTIAQVLAAAGWRTGAFVSCAALDHRFGFAVGFEQYDDRFRKSGRITDIGMPERRADATVARTLEWAGGLAPEDRLFLWVHLFDPHLPYDPPPSLRATWVGIARSSPPAALAAEVYGAYLGEVAFADQQIGVLHAGLEAAGRSARQTCYLVLGDHGEGLGDHGALTHGLLLHSAAMRVPLLLVAPQLPAGRRQGLTSTADVFATLLDLAGEEAPTGDGRSLLRQASGDQRSLPMETLFGQRSYGLSPAFGLRTRQWLWEASPADHLWDVEHDPAETADLAAARPQIVAQLQEQYQKIADTPSDRGAGKVSQELIDDLQALGYVTGNLTTGEGDLRTYVREGEDLHMALLGHEKAGRFAEAEVVVQQLIEQYPRSPQLWIEAGFTAVQLGRLDQAEERFGEATRLAPESTQARLNLANVYLVTQRRELAAAEYQRVLELDPEDLYGLYNLGNLRSQQGRFREAAAAWRRFVELYPDHQRAASVAGRLQQWQRQGLIGAQP
jgi:arylsulfatase A-like enzyme